VDAALERTRGAGARFASVDRALTQREREVMLLVADGLSNKDVGRRLNVSEGTVKVHLNSIYKKVAVTNRTALAKFSGQYRDWTE
jgi:two-component system nitrate/nitrite response regulator NarL